MKKLTLVEAEAQIKKQSLAIGILSIIIILLLILTGTGWYMWSGVKNEFTALSIEHEHVEKNQAKLMDENSHLKGFNEDLSSKNKNLEEENSTLKDTPCNCLKPSSSRNKNVGNNHKSYKKPAVAKNTNDTEIANVFTSAPYEDLFCGWKSDGTLRLKSDPPKVIPAGEVVVVSIFDPNEPKAQVIPLISSDKSCEEWRGRVKEKAGFLK